jgi:hypothetical protein
MLNAPPKQGRKRYTEKTDLASLVAQKIVKFRPIWFFVTFGAGFERNMRLGNYVSTCNAPFAPESNHENRNRFSTPDRIAPLQHFPGGRYPLAGPPTENQFRALSPL